MTYIIAKIDVAESLLDIALMSNKCLNKIFTKTVPENIQKPIEKLKIMMALKTDTITLKKKLGNFMFQQNKYPF